MENNTCNFTDNYYKDEVRCGFLVPSAIKQLWAAELVLLEKIDKVCRENDISYFADWGTLLGAVRHGGFVPWDDDLDIVMKRADYRKFLKVAAEKSEDFVVQTYENLEPDKWQFMGKVVNRERACFEPQHMREYHNFPFIVCIDIFVLDYVYEDEVLENNRKELCLYLLALSEQIVNGEIAKSVLQANIGYIKEKWGEEIPLLNDPVEMGRNLYRIVEKHFSEVDESESGFLCQLFPWGLKGIAKKFSKRLYSKAIRIPFEYMTIPAPLGFDGMLRAGYGDYFRILKSVGAHSYPCFENSKEKFYKSLDMDVPEYGFSEEDLYAGKQLKKSKTEQTYKYLIREAISSIGVPTDINDIIEFQQLAIDMGNMIEEVNGKDNKAIPMIEAYCESLYELYCNFEKGTEAYLEAVTDSYNRLNEFIKTDILNRNTIVYMPAKTTDWKRLENRYQADISAGKDVIVCPLDYYSKDYDGRITGKIIDGLGIPNSVKVIDSKGITPEYLEFLHPDEIVITEGIDQWNETITINPAFYSDKLISCTDKLTYVCPYKMDNFDESSERAYHNMKYYVTCPGVVRADEVVVSSEMLRKTYIRKLTEFSGENYKDEWNKRVVVDTEIERPKTEVSSTKERKLLYCINIGSLLEYGDVAIGKIENSIGIINCSDGVTLEVCTFPAINDDILKTDEGMFDKLNALLSKYEISPATNIDVDDFEAYYGDGSSYVLEFVRRNKPVLIQKYD